MANLIKCYLILVILSTATTGMPHTKRQLINNLQTDQELLPNNESSVGEGKAAPNPLTGATNAVSQQPAAAAIVNPIRDRVTSGATGQSSTPTLFIGGFSVMMIPMPGGMADLQQFTQAFPLSQLPMSGLPTPGSKP